MEYKSGEKVNQTPFLEFFKKFPIILGEGAVIERLRRNTDFELDPFIVNSAFIYDKAKRTALETIYRQYLDIGFQYDLPLLLSTPTWRANQKRIAAAVNPEELDNSAELLEEEPDAFGQSVASLHKDLGMKILGGCCGTDHRHIRYLAKQLTSYYI